VLHGQKLQQSHGDISQRGGDVLIGPTGMVRLFFDRTRTSFRNLDLRGAPTANNAPPPPPMPSAPPPVDHGFVPPPVESV